MSAASAGTPPVEASGHVAGPHAYRWARGILLGASLGITFVAGVANLIPAFAEAPRSMTVGVVFWPVFAAALWWVIGKIPFFARMPRGTKWLAFLWGAVVAGAVAGVLEGPIGPKMALAGGAAAEWVPAAVAPFIEETSKALGVLVVFLFLRRPFTLVDGFATGAMVGLGFQISEDLGYGATNAWLAGSDGWAAIVQSLLPRAVTGVFSHWLLTGVFGVGLAYLFVKKSAGWGKRVGVLVALGAAAMAMHFLWNSPGPDGFAGTWVVPAVKALVILVVGLLVMRWARDDEGIFYTRYLKTLDPEVVTGGERVALARGRSRFGARRVAARSGGWAGWRHQGRLQTAQSALAVDLAVGNAQAAADAQSRVQELKALPS